LAETYDIEWLSLPDLGISPSHEETGVLLVENAIPKALFYAEASGCLTLADDSGLEVDALGTLPGVDTATFGGPGLSDGQRIHALLNRMKGIDWVGRKARFRSVLALAERGRVLATAEGVCDGWIANYPIGTNDFGYGSIFVVPEQGRTLAELTQEEKSKVSHRTAAFIKLVPRIQDALSALHV